MPLETDPNQTPQSPPASEPSAQPQSPAAPPAQETSFLSAFEAQQAQQPQQPASPPASPPPGQQPPAQPQLPQQPSQQPAPQFSSIREAFIANGYDFGFDSDDALLRSFEQMRELAQIGRQYAPYRDQISEYLASQQAQPPQAPPPQQPQQTQQPSASAWSVPEYDPEWRKLVRWDDESGQFVPANMYVSPEIARKVNAYEKWRVEAADRLVREPDKVFRELSQGWIEETINERVEQALRQHYEQQSAQQYVQQNLQQLYEVDANGQVRLDSLTGEPVLTPMGQAYVAYGQEAYQYGIHDEAAIRRYAQQHLDRDIAAGVFGVPQQPQQPQVPQQPQQHTAPNGGPLPPRNPANGQFVSPQPPPLTPQQRNEANKQTFLQRALNGAGRLPNRDGTVVTGSDPDGPPQNQEDGSFFGLAQQSMRERGLIP